MSKFVKRKKKKKYLQSKLEIRIEKHIKEKLERLATKNNTTISELVRSLIYKKLREEGLK